MPRRTDRPTDKYLAAINVLNRARDAMLDQMADTVLTLGDEFAEGGFQINEFLELHGSRLHFLCLLIGQFELLAESRTLADRPPPTQPKDKRPKRRDAPKSANSGEEAPPPGEEASDA